MSNTFWSPHWRPLAKRPFLLLLVGILAAAVVAAVLQVRPQAHAATIDDVQVTQHEAEASLKAGTTATCVITARTTLTGAANRVGDFIKSVSKSAQDLGMKIQTGEGGPAPGLVTTDLILSYEFELTQYAIAPESCSTKNAVEAHRGRKALELPSWARGMVAAAASIAVYLAVSFAVAALFAFLAPEFEIYGELVGGCIAGFASTFVSNTINGVPQSANLTASAVWCVAGAILNVALGSLKQMMVDALRAHIMSDLPAVVSEGIARGAGHDDEMKESFRSAASRLSDALGDVL